MTNNLRKEYWEDMIKSYNPDKLAADLNPTWNPTTRTYSEYTPICKEALDLMPSITSILDFGFGFGRNYSYLKTLSPSVVGYDLKDMLDKYRILMGERAVLPITSDWNNVKNTKFDLVYQCTVFQHMDLEDLVHKIFDISQITKYLYMRTRVYNDVGRDFRTSTGGTNIFSIIDYVNVLTPLWCSIPIEQAKILEDETHYDILYKVK